MKRRTGIFLVIVLALGVFPTTGAWAHDGGTDAISDGTNIRVLAGPAFEFASPQSPVLSQGNVWFANSQRDGLTAVNATTMKETRVTGSRGFGVGQFAIAGSGTGVWTIENTKTSRIVSLEELDSKGIIQRSFPEPKARLGNPSSMNITGNYLWTTGGTSPFFLVETNLTTGRIVRLITRHVSQPEDAVADGKSIWVWNAGSNAISQFSTATGQFITYTPLKKISGWRPPAHLALGAGKVWIPMGSELYAISTVTGRVMMRLTATSYRFDAAYTVASNGILVWIPNNGNNTVTVLEASNGSLRRVLGGSAYRFDNPLWIAVLGSTVWVTNDFVTLAGAKPSGSVTVFPT